MKAILPVDTEMMDILLEFKNNNYVFFTIFDVQNSIYKNFYNINELFNRELLTKIDEVFIVDTEITINPDFLLDIIAKLNENKIKISILANKYFNLLVKAEDILEKKVDTYKDLLNERMINPYNIENNDKLQEIETPIICVMGIADNVQKMKVETFLFESLKKGGYKSVLIGSDNISIIMGEYSVPEYIQNEEYSSLDKIIKFNHFVKEIEKIEKPDVIIIGIPGGIVPLDKKHYFGFGIWAYQILNAINPDVSILNLFAGNYTKEFFEEMIQLGRYRFNVDIDAFFISKYVPVSNSLLQTDIIYAEKNDKFSYDEEFEVFSNNNIEKLYQYVLENLEMYGNFKHI